MQAEKLLKPPAGAVLSQSDADAKQVRHLEYSVQISLACLEVCMGLYIVQACCSPNTLFSGHSESICKGLRNAGIGLRTAGMQAEKLLTPPAAQPPQRKIPVPSQHSAQKQGLPEPVVPHVKHAAAVSALGEARQPQDPAAGCIVAQTAALSGLLPKAPAAQPAQHMTPVPNQQSAQNPRRQDSNVGCRIVQTTAHAGLPPKAPAAQPAHRNCSDPSQQSAQHQELPGSGPVLPHIKHEAALSAALGETQQPQHSTARCRVVRTAAHPGTVACSNSCTDCSAAELTAKSAGSSAARARWACPFPCQQHSSTATCSAAGPRTQPAVSSKAGGWLSLSLPLPSALQRCHLLSSRP